MIMMSFLRESDQSQLRDNASLPEMEGGCLAVPLDSNNQGACLTITTTDDASRLTIKSHWIWVGVRRSSLFNLLIPFFHTAAKYHDLVCILVLSIGR